MLNKFCNWLNRILIWTAALFLAAMVLLTCSNIALRLFSKPVKGTIELMGLFGAVVAGTALGATQMRKENIAVDILVNNFSPSVRRVLRIINSLLCMLFFSVTSWKIADWAYTFYISGEVTETLRIVFYPFTLAVAIGTAALAVVFLSVIVTTFNEYRKPAEGGSV